MKKSGAIVLIILLVSIISFVSIGSSINVIGKITGKVTENVTVGEADNVTESNDTESNNETEIEYINGEDEEQLAGVTPEAGITPDSIFYGLDVLVDNARATLTPSSLGKAKIRLDIMEERMAEMEEMASKNKTTEAKKAELQAQKQMQKFESSVEKIKKIKKKDALELKERIQRNAATLEILKQRLLDYDSDWADAMADALEIMKASEHILANIPEDFDPEPAFVFSPGTSTFESMIAQCIESGESPEECEKVEDFCKEMRATTAKECVEMLSSGFLVAQIRTIPYGEERPPDPHNCSGFHSDYITQKKYCCDDSDGTYSPEWIENIVSGYDEHVSDVLRASPHMLNYYYRRGTVDYKVINLRTDEIEHEIYTDSCDGNTLTEWVCVKRDRMSSEEYECPNGCEDGKCITCNSDSICNENEDCSCSDCEGKNNGCRHSEAVCQDGECIKEEVPEGPPEPPGEMQVAEGECTDSDGGMDYSAKGIISIDEHNVREDYCNDNSWLIEYFCGDNNVISSVPYSCQNGCEDGECV